MGEELERMEWRYVEGGVKNSELQEAGSKGGVGLGMRRTGKETESEGLANGHEHRLSHTVRGR